MRKLFFIVLSVLLLEFCTPALAQVETVAFMHKTFDVRLPDDYCRIPADSRFYKMHQRAYGKSVKLGFMAAKCSMVRDLVEGRAHSVPHFIAIEQIGIDRKFERFSFGKWAYVTLITAFKPKFAKLERRLKEKLTEYETTITKINYEPVKKTSSEVLFEATGVITDPKGAVNAHVFAYTRLYYKIPVAIHVYDENPSDAQLDDSLRELAAAVKSL